MTASNALATHLEATIAGLYLCDYLELRGRSSGGFTIRPLGFPIVNRNFRIFAKIFVQRQGSGGDVANKFCRTEARLLRFPCLVADVVESPAPASLGGAGPRLHINSNS